MTIERRILIFWVAFVLLVTVNSSFSQPSPPATQVAPTNLAQVCLPPLQGWATQVTNNGVVLNAPGREAERPALTFLPPMRPQGDVKQWFGNVVMNMAQSAG